MFCCTLAVSHNSRLAIKQAVRYVYLVNYLYLSLKTSDLKYDAQHTYLKCTAAYLLPPVLEEKMQYAAAYIHNYGLSILQKV